MPEGYKLSDKRTMASSTIPKRFAEKATPEQKEELLKLENIFTTFVMFQQEHPGRDFNDHKRMWEAMPTEELRRRRIDVLRRALHNAKRMVNDYVTGGKIRNLGYEVEHDHQITPTVTYGVTLFKLDRCTVDGDTKPFELEGVEQSSLGYAPWKMAHGGYRLVVRGEDGSTWRFMVNERLLRDIGIKPHGKSAIGSWGGWHEFTGGNPGFP